MLLWLSSRRWKFGIGDVLPVKGRVDFAGEVALQAAQDVFGGQLFSGAAVAVGAGLEQVASRVQATMLQGAVGLPIAAARQLMASVLPLDAGMGATPQSAAKAASEPIRSGLSPAVTSSWAAVS